MWTREAGPGSLAISVEGPSKAHIDFKDRKDGSCYVSYIVEVILAVFSFYINYCLLKVRVKVKVHNLYENNVASKYTKINPFLL